MQDSAAADWRRLGDDAPGWRDLYAGVESSAMRPLSDDADYQTGQEAQRQALRQMQGIAGAGGYTDVERGQIRQAQQQAAQYERSQRLAALQAMQSRGMAGGGAEMASRLQAQQSGANRAANDATNIATAAQQRALQAMQAGSDMGARLSNNRANQTFKRDQAVDAFNRANAQARGNAVQQAYQNRQNNVAGLSGQYNANAGSLYQQAQQQAQAPAGLVNTVASIYGASQSGGSSS